MRGLRYAASKIDSALRLFRPCISAGKSRDNPNIAERLLTKRDKVIVGVDFHLGAIMPIFAPGSILHQQKRRPTRAQKYKELNNGLCPTDICTRKWRRATRRSPGRPVQRTGARRRWRKTLEFLAGFMWESTDCLRYHGSTASNHFMTA